MGPISESNGTNSDIILIPLLQAKRMWNESIPIVLYPKVKKETVESSTSAYLSTADEESAIAEFCHCQVF